MISLYTSSSNSTPLLTPHLSSARCCPNQTVQSFILTFLYPTIFFFFCSTFQLFFASLGEYLPCELKSLAYFALLFLSLFLCFSFPFFFGPALSFLVAACKEEVKSPFYFFFSIFFLLLPGRSFVCLVFPFGCFFFWLFFFSTALVFGLKITRKVR